MRRRIAALWTRSPSAVLVVCVLAAAVLSLASLGVPESLSVRDGTVGDSPAERTATALGAELGYEAEPAFQIALAAAEPIDAETADVAIRTTRGQVEAVQGVAAVREGERAADGSTAALAVHLIRDADPDTVTQVHRTLETGIDPGPFRLLVGGNVPTAEGARDAILDDALALVPIGILLLAVVLVAALGRWLGPAALLGSVLAVGGTVAALGLLGEFVRLDAVALVPAVTVAVVCSVEASASLLYRYREESATLGGGAEALEYSLRSVLRGAAIGMLSAALVGAALCAIPISSVQSVGAGIAVAALLGPSLALPPCAAALSLRAADEMGEALPLVSASETVTSGPLAYRLLFGIGRARRRGLVAALPLIVVLLLGVPLFDAKAIGLDAAELPAEQEAAATDAELSAAFGSGASGPLTAVAEAAPGAELAGYRDAISRIDGVAATGLASPAGALAHFEVLPDSRPRSLAAQRTAASIQSVPAPFPSGTTGPAAAVREASARLADDLPLVLLVALLGTAALWSALFRAAFGPMLALASAIGPLLGLGAMVWVFGGGRLEGLLDYPASGAPHMASYVVVGAALLAIALWRGAQTASALHEERSLGGGTAGSLARSGQLTLIPAAIATLAGIVTLGIWIVAPLTPAKELAVGVSVGLLADLLLARALLAPALARLSIEGGR